MCLGPVRVRRSKYSVVVVVVAAAAAAVAVVAVIVEVVVHKRGKGRREITQSTIPFLPRNRHNYPKTAIAVIIAHTVHLL